MDRRDQKNMKDVKDRNQLPSDTKNLSEMMEFDFDDILMEDDSSETAAPPKKEPVKKKKTTRWQRLSWIKEAVLVVIVLCLTAVFIADVDKVKDGSMNPVLAEGDSVVVSKIIYRLKEPARGDLVSYKTPEGEKLFGRIVGMPGDTLSIEENGNISINGNRYQNGRTVYLTGQTSYPIEIPEGSYFILCDNAREGKDSRYRQIGMIQRNAIRGKVICRIWPKSSWGVVK